VLVAGGLHLIFFPQHFAGLMGMPRRTQTYFPGYGLEIWNLLSSLGVVVAVSGALIFAFDFFRSLRRGKVAGNDPWDARTLEWSVSSPPPAHDFDTMPVVTDRDMFWVMKHPELSHGAPEPELARVAEAADAQGVPLPGQSWYPIIMAFVMFVGGYAVIYHNWVLAGLCFLILMVLVYGYALEGVGGSHIHPNASAKTAAAGAQGD